ncbi:hypothetical protein ACHAXA_011672 [Cyclostephanos tholiformis]|uniref:Uncharacterized protein n=1 Tax=Cyclostephanos tholiformis TaxID=382380 RepID=A0ABD3SET4_9STRA
MTKIWTTEDTLKVLAMLFIGLSFCLAVQALFNAQARLNARMEAKAAKK